MWMKLPPWVCMFALCGACADATPLPDAPTGMGDTKAPVDPDRMVVPVDGAVTAGDAFFPGGAKGGGQGSSDAGGGGGMTPPPDAAPPVDALPVTPACDVFAQDDCEFGQGCYPMLDPRGIGRLECRLAGDFPEGVTCQTPDVCAPGLSCIEELSEFRCGPLCDRDHLCAQGFICVQLDPFEGLGFCRP